MRLHEVVKEIYRRNKDKVEALCDPMGLSLSQIYRYGEPPEGSGTPIPADKIITLTNETEDPGALKHIANECGYTICALPEKPGKKNHIKDVARELHRVIKEYAELVKESSQALEDGTLTTDERCIMLKETNHCLEELLNYREILK